MQQRVHFIPSAAALLLPKVLNVVALSESGSALLVRKLKVLVRLLFDVALAKHL